MCFFVGHVNEESVSQDENGSDLINRICYNAEYRKAEMLFDETNSLDEDESDNIDYVSDTDSDDDDDIDEYEDIVEIDKYLIFITGYKTYSPHQIGNEIL